MKAEYSMTTLKFCGSFLYSLITAAAVVQVNDSYEAVFTDIFFWVSAIIGTGLMLSVDRIDPKAKKIGIKRIIFSILATCTIVLIAGGIRADHLEGVPFKRSYYFYSIVIGLCAIAPELIRLLIINSPEAISRGAIRGMEKRTENWIGGSGKDTEYVEPEIPNEDEQ